MTAKKPGDPAYWTEHIHQLSSDHLADGVGIWECRTKGCHATFDIWVQEWTEHEHKPDDYGSRFQLFPPGRKTLAAKRTGALSGLHEDHYAPLPPEQQDSFLATPVIKAFWDDDDLQQMTVCSTNIGLVYSFQKWYEKEASA